MPGAFAQDLLGSLRRVANPTRRRQKSCLDSDEYPQAAAQSHPVSQVVDDQFGNERNGNR